MRVHSGVRSWLGMMMGAICLAGLAGCESDNNLILPTDGVYDVADGMWQITVRNELHGDCPATNEILVDTLQVCTVDAFSFPFVLPSCMEFEFNIFASACQASGNDGDCRREVDSAGWGLFYPDLWTVTVQTQVAGSGACADTCEQTYSVSGIILSVESCPDSTSGRTLQELLAPLQTVHTP